jgi:low affinity Fe/Cu permease
MEHSTNQRRVSRGLHWVGEATSRAGVAAMVAFIVFLYAILLSIFGFPGHWEEGFSTFAAAISLVMLFVIQHTQSRQQIATQLKLDELIKAIPEADDLLVHIETAQDEELIEREQDHIAHHESLRDPTNAEDVQ